MDICYENVAVDVFPLCGIDQLVICQKTNQHATFYLEGLIPEEACGERLVFSDYFDLPIHVKVNGTVEFTFLIQTVKFFRKNDLNTVTVYGVSSTIKMDRQKHDRSFQNASNTYQDIFDAVGAPYSLDHVIAGGEAKKKTGGVVIQYDETDWEFFLRMASHVGAYVYAVPRGEAPQIYIDKRSGNPIPWEREGSSVIQSRDFSSGIFGIYHQIYPLGQAVSLNGRLYFLKSSQLYFQNSQLKNKCLFVTAEGCVCDKIDNDRIIGASLPGNVIGVENTQVKIKLDIDSGWTQTGDNTHWFDYMSVYSSPEGNGWYFMPEIGDRIYLKVPQKEERAAYAAGAVHVTNTDRSDPEIKFIKTRDGKMIRFTPDEIDIIVSSGTCIKLYDKGGIEMLSSGDINLSAGKDLDIRARREVAISGKRRVTIEKGDSEIVVSDNIRAAGKKVKLI